MAGTTTGSSPSTEEKGRRCRCQGTKGHISPTNPTKDKPGTGHGCQGPGRTGTKGDAIIYLTSSPNDRDMVKPLGGLAVVAPLKHGDFAWGTAEGWDGAWQEKGAVMVCGDRKKLPDLLNCMDDGRHLDQIRRAHEAGYRFQFVAVEDNWREARNGEAEYYRSSPVPPVRQGELKQPRTRGWRKSGVQFSRVDAYLNQLHYLMGVQVIHTRTAKQTARAVIDLYRMFQQPPEDHDSLKRFYHPPLQPMLMRRPSLVRRIAKELTGIGWDRSLAVEAAFPSPKAMMEATVEDWVALDGIGKKTAEAVVREIAGSETLRAGGATPPPGPNTVRS